MQRAQRFLAFLPPVTPRVAPAAPAVSQGGEGAWGEVVPMHQVGSAGAGRRAGQARRRPVACSSAAVQRGVEAWRWRSERGRSGQQRGGVAVAQRARSERSHRAPSFSLCRSCAGRSRSCCARRQGSRLRAHRPRSNPRTRRTCRPHAPSQPVHRARRGTCPSLLPLERAAREGINVVAIFRAPRRLRRH